MAFDLYTAHETFGVPVQEPGTCAYDLADPETPESLCGRNETAAVIRAAVGGLESRHAELLALRYQDDLTLREIGARWGVSESAVCQMHATALERIRTSLELMGLAA